MSITSMSPHTYYSRIMRSYSSLSLSLSQTHTHTPNIHTHSLKPPLSHMRSRLSHLVPQPVVLGEPPAAGGVDWVVSYGLLHRVPCPCGVPEFLVHLEDEERRVWKG